MFNVSSLMRDGHFCVLIPIKCFHSGGKKGADVSCVCLFLSSSTDHDQHENELLSTAAETKEE